MIANGTQAPDLNLTDHFGRTLTLSMFRGLEHVLLLFYPLDFTPT